MATMKSLEDVFINELQDLLHAEKQITKALPRMVKKAAHSELKECLQQHLAETEGQIGRLEQCFELLGRRPRARKCTGMEGLIDEGKETLHEDAHLGWGWRTECKDLPAPRRIARNLAAARWRPDSGSLRTKRNPKLRDELRQLLVRDKAIEGTAPGLICLPKACRREQHGLKVGIA
jgi:hypothetical protein